MVLLRRHAIQNCRGLSTFSSSVSSQLQPAGVSRFEQRQYFWVPGSIAPNNHALGSSEGTSGKIHRWWGSKPRGVRQARQTLLRKNTGRPQLQWARPVGVV